MLVNNAATRHGRSDIGAGRRVVRHHVRRRRARAVLSDRGAAAQDDRPRIGCHRQHLLDGRVGRRPLRAGRRGRQGGTGILHPVLGGGVRRQRDSRQHRRARAHPHRRCRRRVRRLVGTAGLRDAVGPDRGPDRDRRGDRFPRVAARATSPVDRGGGRRHCESFTRSGGASGANGRVNTVAPPTPRGGVGALRDGLEQLGSATPLGRTADPTEIAEAIVFLASPQASYLTGATVVVDGGFTAI